MTRRVKTRREALRKIIGTVAAAAGMSAVEVEKLLAQVSTVRDLAHLTKIRTSDPAVKALKVLLAPKAQAARVFRGEYGRQPALVPAVDPKTLKLSCGAYLGVATAACFELSCGVVVCNGLGEDMLFGAGWLPSNDAGASGFNRTGGSTGGGGYNKTDGCVLCTGEVIVPSTGGARINPAWLEAMRRDAFINALMAEYGVNSAESLEGQLTQALAERRAER